MADTNWQDFPDSAPQAADIFLAMRGAGGINSTMAQLAAFAAANAADGAVGAPGQSFANDPDTGFYRPGANLLAGVVGGIEGWRLTSTGLGIGVIAPICKLDILGANDVQRLVSSTATAGLLIGDSGGTVRVGTRSGAYIVDAGGVERVRLTTGGNFGIGTLAPERPLHVQGSSIWKDNQLFSGVSIHNTLSTASADSISYIDFGNQNSIGDAHLFFRHRVDGSSQFELGLSPAGSKTADRRISKLSVDAAGVYSGGDNTMILGWSGNRWAGGTIATAWVVTSDQRAKQDIGAVPDEWLDAWGALDWVRYKFRDAAQIKGDDARWHIGLIAQEVKDRFAERGLDACAIGLLCYDEWDEQREPIYEMGQVGSESVIIDRVDTGLFDAQGQPVFREVTEEQPIMTMVDTGETRVILEAGDRWGLRYDECQAMEAAWQRRELARKDALIAQLADRLAVLEAA